MESREPRLRVLPDRIWVLGPTGAGKSTLAARLAAHMGVEPTHIDDVHWQPGWTEAPRDQTAARVAEVAEGSRWVVDGNYSFVRKPLEDRIQLYVWLDLPLRVTLPRLLRRGLVRSLRRVECCNGNYESLRLTFLDRESLLLYAVRSDARRRRQLTRQLRHRNLQTVTGAQSASNPLEKRKSNYFAIKNP
mgnify:CR=1 FL=1